jgi:hypothetical protein
LVLELSLCSRPRLLLLLLLLLLRVVLEVLRGNPALSGSSSSKGRRADRTSWNGQTNRFEEDAVWRTGRRFDRGDHPTYSFDSLVLLLLGEGRDGKDLADHLTAVVRVAEDLGQGLVVRRSEDRRGEDGRSRGVGRLRDD